MKYFTLIFLFLLFSCGEKELVQLPKSNVTIVEKVNDLTPVYIFFKIEGKDTIADVNRKNTIISTNWVFNIDKRLPLKLVIPQVMKLQEKKRKDSDYKNELAQNYYTYMDSVKKNLAFISFEKVYYKMEKPNSLDSFLKFRKNGMIQFNQTDEYDFKKEKLEEFLNNLFIEHECEVIFSFDENMSYGEYIQNKILIKNLIIKKKGIWINKEKEFIY